MVESLIVAIYSFVMLVCHPDSIYEVVEVEVSSIPPRAWIPYFFADD